MNTVKPHAMAYKDVTSCMNILKDGLKKEGLHKFGSSAQEVVMLILVMKNHIWSMLCSPLIMQRTEGLIEQA